jgi:hypothetical protein
MTNESAFLIHGGFPDHMSSTLPLVLLKVLWSLNQLSDFAYKE